MRPSKILLAEYNQDDIELTLMANKAKNIVNKIDVVTDGEEAPDYLFCKARCESREKANPELVILELQLPKIGGLEVLKSLRAGEKTKLLPVSIFTSSNKGQDILSGYSMGANSRIGKPVDAVLLEDAIGSLGLYRVLLNAPPLIP